MAPGRVRLTASTDDGRFSAATDVEVVPRVVDWSVGAGAGYLMGTDGLAAPYFAVKAERRLPVPTLYLRLDGGTYRASVEEIDPITGLKIEMKTTVFPIGVGGIVQRGQGRLPVRFGGQVIFSPYTISASYGGQQASSGSGWMLPGAAFLAGAGWRVAGGELYTEAKYLFLLAPGETLGWEGALGGIVGAVGYKLLY